MHKQTRGRVDAFLDILVFHPSLQASIDAEAIILLKCLLHFNARPILHSMGLLRRIIGSSPRVLQLGCWLRDRGVAQILAMAFPYHLIQTMFPLWHDAISEAVGNLNVTLRGVGKASPIHPHNHQEDLQKEIAPGTCTRNPGSPYNDISITIITSHRAPKISEESFIHEHEKLMSTMQAGSRCQLICIYTDDVFS